MIIQYGYQAYGNRQQSALGIGVAQLWLSGSGIVGQSGVLVGYWRNVTYLEASAPRITRQAQPIGRLTLEAKHPNG